jgi:predicted permease
MRSLRGLWVRGLRARRMQEDFDAELESHVAMHTDEGVRAGLDPTEARRQALIRLGGEEQVRQAYRDRATLPPMEGVLQDVRFAQRQMRKAPGFAITAVMTLALGIGANAVIYTLVDSILLRPLPFARQDRLMRITGTTMPVAPKGWIRALGENSKGFASLAGFGPDAESNVSENDAPDRVFGTSVTVNALETLGIRPTVGDFFNSDDATAGQDQDVVLSYGYWRTHYGGETSAIGRTMRIDGVSRRIIGVMPVGVHFPYADTQFVIPVSFRRADPRDPWTVLDLHIFGRLSDGVTPAKAQDELRRLHGVLLPLFPWRMPDVWASDMTVVPLLESETGAMRPRLLLLFGAVGLILLIACANVANLMLARATAREQELAIRGALGASRKRLIQQLLSESAVLGVTAGLVGLGAAFASLRVFVGLLPADTPRIQDVSLHVSDILFTMGASVFAGLLFGVIPAIKMASLNLLAALRMGSRGLMGKSTGFGVSIALVMAQIGLSVMVITAAGLMLHSLYQISRIDPGFRTAGTVTAEVALDASACREVGRCQSFYATLLERASGASGVERVALTDSMPLSGRDNNYVYDAEGHPRDAQQGALLATGRTVTPSYFDVLGMRLERGRLLTEEDASGASRAVVVNERMAEHLWPNLNPIGKRILDVNDAPAPAVWDGSKASVIVGVVRNARDGSLEGGFDDEVYLPMTPTRAQPVMYVLLRTHTTPAETAAGLRRAVAGIDSLIPVTRVRALDEVVALSVAAPRALAVLLLGFGATGSCDRLGGSLQPDFVHRELAHARDRSAAGAGCAALADCDGSGAAEPAARGRRVCVAGLLGAVALSRVLHSFLFEVSALDPVTYCAARC